MSRWLCKQHRRRHCRSAGQRHARRGWHAASRRRPSDSCSYVRDVLAGNDSAERGSVRHDVNVRHVDVGEMASPAGCRATVNGVEPSCPGDSCGARRSCSARCSWRLIKRHGRQDGQAGVTVPCSFLVASCVEPAAATGSPTTSALRRQRTPLSHLHGRRPAAGSGPRPRSSASQVRRSGSGLNATGGTSREWPGDGPGASTSALDVVPKWPRRSAGS